MQYIDCKKYAQELLDEVKAVPNKNKLVIFTAGDNPASASYVKGKIKDCEYCGIPYEHIKVENEWELYSEIINKANDEDVGGIIVQLPLPKGWDEEFFTNLVPPEKDVDGFVRDSHFNPCTPEGIMYLLNKEIGDLTGKSVLVIGRGKLVGEPIVKMLVDEDCTVTIAHSKTKDLWYHMRYADIIISATGCIGLVDIAECWNAEVIIDAGVSRGEDGKLHGDCFNCENADDFQKITPVPGGVGLLTRAMLMKHMMETNK